MLMLMEELKSLEDLDPKRIWQVSQKLDGVRMQLSLFTDGKIELKGRNSSSLDNDKFPEIIEEARQLCKDIAENVVLDGELIIGSKNGYWFSNNLTLVSSRMHMENIPKIKLLSRYAPSKFVVFDILAQSLSNAPLRERTERLNTFLSHYLIGDPCFPENRIVSIPTQEGNRELISKMFDEVKNLGLEGLCVKEPSSTYENCRSENWKKLKVWSEEDLVAVGRTSKQRQFSALILENENGEARGNVNFISQPPEIEEKILKMEVSYTKETMTEMQYYFTKPFKVKVKCLPCTEYYKNRSPVLKEVII